MGFYLNKDMSTGWSKIKYRQDLPPAGGYKPLPYKRSLVPLRLTGLSIFGVTVGLTYIGLQLQKARVRVHKANQAENDQAFNALAPLLQAENDRRDLRWTKEKIESEALNIVGAGYDPDYLPGNLEVMNNKKRWESPHSICDHRKYSTGDDKLTDSMRYFYTRYQNIQLGP